MRHLSDVNWAAECNTKFVVSLVRQAVANVQGEKWSECVNRESAKRGKIN